MKMSLVCIKCLLLWKLIPWQRIEDPILKIRRHKALFSLQCQIYFWYRVRWPLIHNWGITQISTIFQSYHGDQFTYSFVSWLSHTSNSHNNLSKQQATFPHWLLAKMTFNPRKKDHLQRNKLFLCSPLPKIKTKKQLYFKKWVIFKFLTEIMFT